MTLYEFVEKQEQVYKDQYEKEEKGNSSDALNKTKQTIVLVEEWLDDLEKDFSNLISLDIDQISSLIDQNILDEEFDVTSFHEDLRLIQLLLQGKYQMNFPLEFTSIQEQFIHRFFDTLKGMDRSLKQTFQLEQKKYDEKKEKIVKTKKELDSFTSLKNKIGRHKKLNEKDFLLFYSMIKNGDFSVEEQKEAFINFRLHNTKEDVTVENILQCFDGYDIKEGMEECIKKYSDVLLTSINLENIREVLAYLQEEQEKRGMEILKRFDPLTLLTIVRHGNKKTVSNQLNVMDKKRRYDQAFFETPGVWVIDKKVKRKYTPRKNRGEGHGKIDPIKQIATEISSFDMLDNEEFLLEKGFDVSIGRRKGFVVLKTPNEQVIENYNILQDYKMFDGRDLTRFSVTVLSQNRLQEKCDRMIEFGLLHGPLKVDPLCRNYVTRYPSILCNLTDDICVLLSYLRQTYSDDEYYDKIFSKLKRGTLSPDFLKNHLGYPLNNFVDVTLFKEEHFINQNNCEDLPNARRYNEIILESDKTRFDEDILEKGEIKNLEENYRVEGNPFVYQFGDKTISRYKVLRNYSILQEEKLGEDALLYSICRNTYMNQDTFDKIKGSIKKGDKNEVLKKV